MRAIQAYKANDGSLYPTKKEAAVQNIKTYISDAEPISYMAAHFIVEHRQYIISLLQEIDQVEVA